MSGGLKRAHTTGSKCERVWEGPRVADDATQKRSLDKELSHGPEFFGVAVSGN